MKVEIKFEVKPPIECSEAQITEWIYYELGYSSSIPISNPLCKLHLIPDSKPIIIFTS